MSKPKKHDEPEEQRSMTGREAYNTVSDTVTGVNIRWKDNLFQAVGIAFFILLAVPIGYLFGGLPGALVGILLGLVVGFLITGTILMIYRAVQHARGKHD